MGKIILCGDDFLFNFRTLSRIASRVLVSKMERMVAHQNGSLHRCSLSAGSVVPVSCTNDNQKKKGNEDWT